MSESKTFADLGLSAATTAAINKKGFEEPTAIQAMTIPVMLEDRTDIIAQAQTGTGKTAAFGLPLIELLDLDSREVQALILAPTRELAIQVAEEINSLKGERDIRVAPIYGGQSIDQQLRRLKRGVHIVVGTPGRVIDHLKRRTLKLGAIRHLVLDEADEMLNMGFVEDIEEIMEHTGPNKRTLLFSATMPARIRSLAKKYMCEHEVLTAKADSNTTALTEQIYYEIRASDKFEALCRIIDFEEDFYGLVFCRTKNDVDGVASQLVGRGYDAEPIHGDVSQAQRERTLAKFRKRKSNILVATDVAARGIDVSDLSHVINYALPYDAESYVHRIGRTGRAGKSGTAVTFITPSEYKRLMYIQRATKTDIKKSTIPQVDEILAAKRAKIHEDLSAALPDPVDEQYYAWARDLLEGTKPTQIIAALLNYAFEDELNPDGYSEIANVGKSRGSQLDEEGKARLCVGLGRKDRMTPRKLCDFITRRVPMKPRLIGDIQIMDGCSFVTVPFNKAEQIIEHFKDASESGGDKQLVTHARKPDSKGGKGGKGGRGHWNDSRGSR